MANFLVETSARHVHLTRESVDILFGKGHALTNKKDLSQPGQFACEEKVTVIGPKGSLKASILGPERSADQVELSLTDARTIGLAGVPVRESGDVVARVSDSYALAMHIDTDEANAGGITCGAVYGEIVKK